MKLSRRMIAETLLAAAAVRLLLLYVYYPDGWFSFNNAWEFGQVAQNIAEGRGFSSPFGPGDARTAWFTPLGPLILAAIFGWQGVFTESSLLAVLLLQSAVRVASCLVYLVIINETLKGTRLHRTGVVRLLSLIVCLWPEHGLIVSMPWYTVYQEFFTALLFLSGLRWLANRNSASAVCTGLFAGLVSQFNPVPVPFFVVLVFIFLKRSGFRENAGQAAVSLLTFALIACPWFFRNYQVFGEAVPFRSNLGVEIRQGYSSGAGFVQTRHSPHPAVSPAEKEIYDRVGEIKYAHDALLDALKFIAQNPLQAVRLTAGRAGLFWVTEVLVEKEAYENGPEHEKLSVYAEIAMLIQAIALPLLGIVLVAAGAFKGLPFLSLYVWLLVLVPLPSYLTQVSPWYSHLPKMYLLILVCLMGANLAARRWAGQRQSAGS